MHKCHKNQTLIITKNLAKNRKNPKKKEEEREREFGLSWVGGREE